MKPNVVKPIDASLENVVLTMFGEPVEAPDEPEPPIVKSPLRYPGGKSRAVNQIMGLIPRDLESICSPFVGGGSIELACASRGIEVHAYDAFEPLVEFWQVALEDAALLARGVSKHYRLSRTEFYALQKQFYDIDERFERAAAFYALNRASYSGTTLSGGMSPGHPRFTESSIERLRNFEIDNFNVKLADFTESIPAHSDDFMYLDPPYANGEKLYGDSGNMHHEFDHEALADLIRSRDGWILSYNDCDKVRSLYDGFTFQDVDWAYGMANNRASNEVLILSDDFARVL